jgi:hypothetical protein
MPYSIRPTDEVDLAAEFQAAQARALLNRRNEPPTTNTSPKFLVLLCGLVAGLAVLAIWIWRLGHHP